MQSYNSSSGGGAGGAAGRRRFSSSGSLGASPTINSSPRSRLSISTPRTSAAAIGGSAAGRYHHTSGYYSSSSPVSPNRTSRFTFSGCASSTTNNNKESATSKFRAGRYDRYYSSAASSNLPHSSSSNRYVSPIGGRTYLAVVSNTGRGESPLSKSWPSPARNNTSTAASSVLSSSTGINNAKSRFDRSLDSALSTTAIERRRLSIVGAGGSVPVLRSASSSTAYLSPESRRGSAHSIDLSSTGGIRSTPRPYLGRGSAPDSSFNANRAESLYRPSAARFSSAGGVIGNRFLKTSSSASYNNNTDFDISISRRGSSASTATGMSRAASPSPGPAAGNKTLWNKHYTTLSSRWAEQSGAKLISSTALIAGKNNQYSYRPSTRRSSNASEISDGSLETIRKTATASCSSSSYTTSAKRGNKEESDGYDSSSSSSSAAANDENGKNKGARKKDESKNSKSKRNGSAAANGPIVHHHRRKHKNSQSSATSAAIANGSAGVSSMSNNNHKRGEDERQPSSSDNETVQDSLDARIKARRKRLQKSKVMLQEHKEEGWNYRRTLQIEESKQRQQTSAASTISYSRSNHNGNNNGSSKRGGIVPVQVPKSDTTTATTSAVTTATVKATSKTSIGSGGSSKNQQNHDHVPQQSSTSIDNDRASGGGFRVQKVYLQPLKAAVWRNSGGEDDQQQVTAGGGSGGGAAPQSPAASRGEDEQRSPRRRMASSASPAPTSSSSVTKKGSSSSIVRKEKNDSTSLLSTYNRRSPAAMSSRTNEPPPISKRSDFDYNRYVQSIAPKPISYENPTAALLETDQNMELPVPNAKGVNQNGKGGHIDELNGCDVEEKNVPSWSTTKPVRTKPPSVTVVRSVAPPVDNPAVSSVTSTAATTPNHHHRHNSLNCAPTPFRRASLSPGRRPTLETITSRARGGFGQSVSSEKLSPLPPAASITAAHDDDDDARKRPPSEQTRKNAANSNNYAVVNVNGDRSSLQSKTPERSSPAAAIALIPIVMAPAKRVPEKLTPLLMETFSQPSDQMTKGITAAPNPPKTNNNILSNRESTPPKAPPRGRGAGSRVEATIISTTTTVNTRESTPTRQAAPAKLPNGREATPTASLVNVNGKEATPSRVVTSRESNGREATPTRLTNYRETTPTKSTTNRREPTPTKVLTARGSTPTAELPPKAPETVSNSAASGGSNVQSALNPLAIIKRAEETLRLELKKHERNETLQKESLVTLYQLPSVDKEILHLLTLGEELNNHAAAQAQAQRLSNNANIQTSIGADSSLQPQQAQSKFVQSFRTAMPQKATHSPLHGKPAGGNRPSGGVDAGQSATSYQGSRESLNSCGNFNAAPKPWGPAVQQHHQSSRGGSSDSLASSFATAPCTFPTSRANNNNNNNNREVRKNSLTVQPTFQPCPKPWSANKLGGGKEGLSTSAEPLPTLVECPSEPNAHTSTRGGGKKPNSLDVATRKVDEMLRLARLKHKQQQRREKIILLNNNCNVGKSASQELDNVYESIRLDYAEAQESRRRHQRQQSACSDNENVFMKPQLVTVASTVRLPSPRKAMSGDEGYRRQPAPAHQHHRHQSSRKAPFIGQETNKAHNPPPGVRQHMTGGQYDNSKLDYTKRWLEGDLKSLARDTKPDLLQFNSTTTTNRAEFDQRSVGSASAEVAAITNKERLQAMRAVPDLVPAEHQQQNPQLVKPAPVIPAKQQGYHHHQKNTIGNFLGPPVGQPGSKSSSFGSGFPSSPSHQHQPRQQAYPVAKFDPQQQQQQYHQHHLQPPKQQFPINLNSGGIQQAIDHLRSSVESLSHSERSWTFPKKVCEHGHVRKHVDLFDRMSDNDSELSFRSADHVAYRSALYKPSKRISLTNHMAHFVRRFESDEENNSGGCYRRFLHPPRIGHHNELHSDDEARLAAFRHKGSTNTYHQFARHPFNSRYGQSNQVPVTNGNGSTQSLPVTISHHHHHSNHPAYHQGPFPMVPTRRPREDPSNGTNNNNNHNNPENQQQRRKFIQPPPWLRGGGNATNHAPSSNQYYWSSNSTLTDVETSGFPANRRRVTNHGRNALFTVNDNNMQAVDNLVAELELNTDCSGSVISQRSTGNFPVDRYYYNSHYHQYNSAGPAASEVVVDHSSSRSKLNAIPEQTEQQHLNQNPLEALHLAQQRLEEARRDLKQTPTGGLRKQMLRMEDNRQAGAATGQTTSAFCRNAGANRGNTAANQIQSFLLPTDPHHSSYSNNNAYPRKSSEPCHLSLPRSLDVAIHQRTEDQSSGTTAVHYRRDRPAAASVSRPASYAAPTGSLIAAPTSAVHSSFQPAGGSADHIGGGTNQQQQQQQQKKHATEKAEGNYDNVLIGGCWRPSADSHRQQSKALLLQPDQAPTTTGSRLSPLNSPSTIKIGSVVLGRGGTPPVVNDHQSDMSSSMRMVESQQQSRNPLKSIFQLFNKGGGNGECGKEANNNGDQFASAQLQRSYNQHVSQKAPSTYSLNLTVRPTLETRPAATTSDQWPSNSMTRSTVSNDGNYMHKSSSTNDAHSVKSAMTPDEVRQVDELLASLRVQQQHGGGEGNKAKKSGGSGEPSMPATPAEGLARRGRSQQSKSDEKSNHHEQQRSHSRFRLGLPFWKRS